MFFAKIVVYALKLGESPFVVGKLFPRRKIYIIDYKMAVEMIAVNVR